MSIHNKFKNNEIFNTKDVISHVDSLLNNNDNTASIDQDLSEYVKKSNPVFDSNLILSSGVAINFSGHIQSEAFTSEQKNSLLSSQEKITNIDFSDDDDTTVITGNLKIDEAVLILTDNQIPISKVNTLETKLIEIDNQLLNVSDNDTIIDLTNLTTTHTSQIDILDSSMVLHETQLNSFDVSINSLQNDIDSIETDISEIQSLNNTQNGRISTNESLLTSHTQNLTEIENNLLDTTTSLNDYASLNDANLIESNSNILKNTNDISVLENQVELLEINDTSQNILLSEIDSSLVSFNTHLNEIDNLNTNYDISLSELKTNVDSHTDEILSLNGIAISNSADISILQSSVQNSTDSTTMQINKTSSQSQSAHFNDDVMVYFDFSDSTKLGRDSSGRGKHALNDFGVEQSDENIHSAYFKRIEHSSNGGQFVNNRFMDLSPCIPNIKLQNYTISVNIKPLYDGSTVWSFTDNKSGQYNSYFNVYLGATNMSIIYRINGTIQMKVNTPFPIDGNWHSLIFTNDSVTGNLVYIDGVVVPSGDYETGDESTICDLTFLDESEDKLILGATYIARSNRGAVTRFPFEGYMSDFIVYNRKIELNEIAMLASGVIGYDVIVLVGQSNIVGEAYIEEGIDDDYSIHNNRVFQYDTVSNIDTTNEPYNYTGIYNGMIPATNGRLGHPTIYNTNDEIKQGPWRTFINDYIRYSDIPFRKNIIMVPLGSGGSSFLNKWNPGLQYYEIAIRAMDQVFDKTINPCDSYKVTTMLFNMGESDIKLENMNYKTDFINTYNSFVTNLKGFDNTTPVCLTQISGEYEYIRYSDDFINVSMQQVVNDALIELANENDNFALTKTQGLSYKSDKIHPDMPGYRKLGERYFDTFCQILGVSNKKPKFNFDNNVKDIVINGDLVLKPKNELDQWTNLKLDCFAKKKFNLQGTNALQDTIELNFIKLGPVVIVSMDIIDFIADATGDIIIQSNSIPNELTTSLTHTYTCNTHNFEFNTDGSCNISNNGTNFQIGNSYTLKAFFCIYTTV